MKTCPLDGDALAVYENMSTIDGQLAEISTLQMDTTRMIYAWNEADPAGDDPNAVLYHGTTNCGTQSVNLLGGQQEVPPDPADLQSFDVTVDSVCC